MGQVEAGGSGTGGGGWGWDRWRRVGVGQVEMGGSGTGGGGWGWKHSRHGHVGLSCRKALIVTGWAISLFLCATGLGNSLRASISGDEAFFSVCAAKSHDYQNLLTNGCDSSHESVQDGCKGTCMKF